LQRPTGSGHSYGRKDPVKRGQLIFANVRNRHRVIAAGLVLGLFMVGSLVVLTRAQANPPGTACPVDEGAFPSSDGFDFFHVSNSNVLHSLADLEGYLDVCRTNDAVVAEAAKGNARAIRIDGVNRIQLRAQLQRFYDPLGPDPLDWYTVEQSASVNTGDNRTLEVTTPRSAIPDTSPSWFRVNVRALVRYSNSSLVFYERQTYPVWLGDGPVSPKP
jgi:hypothetical protein